MFECKVYIHIPGRQLPDVEIASYSFDPGLQVGDKVYVQDFEWSSHKQKVKQSFEAMVTMRKNTIEPRKSSNSLFKLQIQIEMADKEELPKLKEILEENS